jgi:hypothetical protein
LVCSFYALSAELESEKSWCDFWCGFRKKVARFSVRFSARFSVRYSWFQLSGASWSALMMSFRILLILAEHMPKRRNRPSNDIAELAAHFQESWNDGQAVAFWLRQHAEELFQYFREGNWTWANIGQALTQAGIVYRTGTPWTGENLRRNLKRTLVPGKRELKLLRTVSELPTVPPPVPTAPMPLPLELTAVVQPSPQPEPEFKLIRPKPGTGVSGATVTPLPVRPPPRVLSEEEAHALAFGRKVRVQLRGE